MGLDATSLLAPVAHRARCTCSDPPSRSQTIVFTAAERPAALAGGACRPGRGLSVWRGGVRTSLRLPTATAGRRAASVCYDGIPERLRNLPDGPAWRVAGAREKNVAGAARRGRTPSWPASARPGRHTRTQSMNQLSSHVFPPSRETP